MRLPVLLSFVASLALLAPSAARATTVGQIEPIARLGDTIGMVSLPIDTGYFGIGVLTDDGHLVFDTADGEDGEALIQYLDGTLTLIVAPGMDAPGGKWPQDVRVMPSVMMNQQGRAVFAAGVFVGEQPEFEVFDWDDSGQQVTSLLRQEMPLGNGMTFVGAELLPVINNNNEIAFAASVKNAAGKVQNGIFFLAADGQLVPVALPRQELPDGQRIAEVCCPTINDAGQVAFQARIQGDLPDAWSAFRWDHGALTPLAVAGSDFPGGELATIWSLWLNNINANVLAEASITGQKGIGLYLLTGDQVVPVAATGQEMPDGGQLEAQLGPSYANDLGQHAVVGVLSDQSTRLYLIDAAGALSQVLRSGEVTSLGEITHIGAGSVGASYGVGLNSRGQIAVTLGIKDGVDTLALLTTAPK